MLREVLDFIHNWFIVAPHVGQFTVVDGGLSPLDFLIEGQRFRIVGSVLNDGLYTYHADAIKDGDDKQAANLADETFGGTVCALGIPRDVIALADEIGEWVDKYGEVVNGPYKSESFGGYQYEKAVSSLVGGGTQTLSWQDIFSKQLNQWRKLC